MRICPEAGDVVEFPYINLHGDAPAMGVGEDIARSRRKEPFYPVIYVFASGDDLHEGIVHADFRHGGWNRYAEGGIITLTG